MISVVFMAHFTWSQIAINFASSCTMIIYFGFVWPFESHKLTKIEIFNEVTAILLCYTMLCFTDWVPAAEIRYAIGWIFIIMVSLHLGTHMTIVLHNTYSIAKQKAKERFYKRQSLTPQIQVPQRAVSSTKIRRKKTLKQSSTPLPLIAEDSDSEEDERGQNLMGLVSHGIKSRL